MSPLALMLGVLCSAAVQAATVTWTGNAGNSNWKTNGNWDTNQEPTSADDVLIPIAASININGAASAGTLTVSAAVTFSGNNTVTVSGNASFTGTAAVTINANLVAASLTKSSTGTLTFGVSSVSSISGAVAVTAGTIALQSNLTAGTFSLPSGTTLSLAFSSNGNTVPLLTTTGNVTLSGALSLTGGNPNLTNSPFTIVTSSGGTISVTGLTLGATPTGYAFGLRISGNSLLLDVAQQPIAVEAVGSASGTCASPLSWSHSIGPTSTDRYLLVGISIGLTGGNAPAPSGVTYNAGSAQPLGLVSSATVGVGSGSSRVFIYGLVAPARGTGTITVSFGGSSCNVVAGSLSYSGVNQATPLGAANNAASAASPVLTVLTTVTGDKIFSVFSSNAATSAAPGQTGASIRWLTTQGSELGAASTLNVTTPGSTIVSWTFAPTSEAVILAVPLHAAAPNRAPDLAEVRWSAGGAAVSVRAPPASDLVGFRVWREAGGKRELLTPGLVAGPVLASRATLLAGAELGWLDRQPVAGAQYLIESLHLDGSTRWAIATNSSGKAPPLASALIGSPASVLTEQPAVRIGPADPRIIGGWPTVRDVQWRLAGDDAVKLVVSRPGVVRVSAESLFAAGVPVGAAASTIQLFRQGRPVPRTILAADGVTLHPGDAVEFYGYGMDTRYSGSAVYWLTAGRGLGLEFRTASGSPSGVNTTTFLAAAEIRERLTWFGALRNGDAEKFFGPAVFSQARQRTLSLEGVDVSVSGARLEVALQGVTQIPHVVSLSVNGLPVGTMTFTGQELGTASIELPPGALLPGDNAVGLVAPAASDISLEQYVRIVYPRRTTRGSGALELTLPGGSETRLDGFDPALTRVLDITNPDAPVRLAVRDESGAAGATAPGTGMRRLVAYLASDAVPPASVVANHPSSWHFAGGADLVVLGPSALFPGVQPLVDRRRSEGLSVAMVDVEDVQDEFASGEKSADAIRGLLAQALNSWATPPRWVLLLGSATYDPRDYLALGGDLVPSGIVQTDALEAASDSWFLGIPGAGSVSIGRLPVRTVAETEAVVSKILGRREADARSPVLLVSDALGTSDFPEMTADLRASLPDVPATVLVRGSEPDDVLRQRFLDAARGGPALVNYTGHASELFWNGNLHTVDDTAALGGGGTSLWIEMTCLTGFFQDPRRQSLAVATLLAPRGGAWGAWGSTSMTYPTEHSALNRALVKAVLIEGKTLGEATREAMAGTTDVDLANTFVLLGDPSARAIAKSTAPLAVSSRSSSAVGCNSSGTAGGTAAVLLAVGLWLATSRQRVRAPRGR